MTTGINESKVLIRDMSSECKCRFDGKKCNSKQGWNNDNFRGQCKNRHFCKKDCIWNPAICSCESRKYLASLMDDSTIKCDESIDSYSEQNKNYSDKF